MHRLTTDCVRLETDTLIAPSLQELAADGRPLVVEHADGRFAGLVTRVSLLRVLAAYPSLVGRPRVEDMAAAKVAAPAAIGAPARA